MSINRKGIDKELNKVPLLCGREHRIKRVETKRIYFGTCHS